MQLVLDIDLDFFLDRILYCKDEPRGRVSIRDYKVDALGEALDFLHGACGLSENNPLPGHICTHHREVFTQWQWLIREGDLRTPFEVVHIDAHADMGFGNNSCVYIAEELLAQPVAKRKVPMTGGSWALGNCNFIAYALALRWIGAMTYVTHPCHEDDVQWVHMKDFSSKSGFVQMKHFQRGFAHRIKDFQEVKKLPFRPEPEVPFQIVPRDQFRISRPPDFLFIAQSPNYTPAAADKLFERLKAFVARLD